MARGRAKLARRRMEHSDRLATIGRLAGGVAHEVNNPASFIQANLTMMLEQLRWMAAAVEAPAGTALSQQRCRPAAAGPRAPAAPPRHRRL
jgi:hypothetical protein